MCWKRLEKLFTWAVSVITFAELSNDARNKPISQYTGGGQKLRTGSLVLPVADNIFK